MEEPQIDIQDWEFVTDPSSSSPSTNPNPNPNPNPFEDSVAIDPNYFPPNPNSNPNPKPTPFEDSASVESDNPSWVDPASQSPQTHFTSSFWSDEGLAVGDVSEKLGFEEKADGEEEEEEEREVKVGGDEGEKGFWWRDGILEMLKLWVLRVKAISPVWTVSVAAAAIVGVVILGRRVVYRMRQRSKGVQLKMAMDATKVSQFMARVARLNEAFYVVKRVPIVRPSLPPSGITSWPMASLR